MIKNFGFQSTLSGQTWIYLWIRKNMIQAAAVPPSKAIATGHDDSYAAFNVCCIQLGWTFSITTGAVK